MPFFMLATDTVDLYAIPDNMMVDPFFDYNIGLPIWFYILTILFAILLLSNIWWIFKRFVMSPVLGYSEALAAGLQQTLIIGKNRALSIKAMEYTDGIVAFKDMIKNSSKWLLQSPKSVGKLGNLSCMLVRDNFDLCIDPITEIAICTIAEKWNKLYPNYIIKNNPDYEILKNNGVLEEQFPLGIEIPVYNTYDPTKIQKFLPKQRSAGFYGEFLDKQGTLYKKDKDKERAWEKYVMPGAALAIGIVIIVISYMFASGGI